MAKPTWPKWAERWDGRKRCRHCKARLVVVQDYTGHLHHGICSNSGWEDYKCDAQVTADPSEKTP